MKQGHIFIVAGPAGVGKNTIVSAILKRGKNFTSIPTYTTRPLRAEDIISQARISVSEKEFMQKAKKGEFVEWKRNHAWLYGKRKIEIQEAIDKGQNLILEVDVKGTDDYKNQFKNVHLIFIQFENLDELRDRIRQNRPDCSAEEIELRYRTAQEEITWLPKFDYTVTNYEGKSEETIKRVEQIIQNELAKA